MIKDVHGNEKLASRWSHFNVVFGTLLWSELHREEQVFFPLSLLLGQSSHHAIHVIGHAIVQYDTVIQCDCVPLRYPMGPISKCREYFHDILDNCPVILSCE